MTRKARGVFHSSGDALRAIEALKEHGYRDEDISVLAKHREEFGPYTERQEIPGKEDTKAEKGAIGGAAIGSAAGLIAGIGLMAVPGIGPILAAGPLAAALSGAAIGAGAGGVTGALVGAGIPEEEIENYHNRVERGDILIVVDTPEDKWELVNEILRENRDENPAVDGQTKSDVYEVTPHAAHDNPDLLSNQEDVNFRR
ncbi:general stress protein [Paenibacillus sp. UNC499MF]|uniref:general stress protein n=1 Tax=Paenibacillus sp. UNC499MF TaxID=1502751 RepID=UPI00089FCD25|nr:general stress protein [Paenibacillus sp. UNC499MF]SEG52289.1 Heat induced stress protein YflT [Paenibacillus sp. UNC499MF]